MRFFQRCQSEKIPWISGTILSLVLISYPAVVFAHAGHNHEFNTETEAATPEGIKVDGETAKRMGIIVQPVTRQFLSMAIKTTGEIETLPNQKVEVTAPIPGKVVELLVSPGTVVKKGQPVAVISSPDLAELRVGSLEKRAEAEADLQQAQADLKLAQQNLELQRQIAQAEITQALTEVNVAQEKYDRDRDLVNAGALPKRQMLEAQAHLAEGKAQLAKASSRKEVLAAENQLKRAQAAVEVAQSRIRLSNAAYEARLQQLGTVANSQGLVTVNAPISGTVADREATLGQSFQDAGGKLMTILNDSSVFATANIYEKDLEKVKIGQGVRVKIASLPNQSFTGRITLIGSTVAGETRVVPVKAELNNTNGQLKTGMFAELDVLTEKTPTAVLVIPSTAVVEANGKQLVYVENGESYQPVEVILGQKSGNFIEVKTGLFDGDRIVNQGAMQLYAQSLRGEKKAVAENSGIKTQDSAVLIANSSVPWWWVLPGGGAVAGSAFWLGRCSLINNRQDAKRREGREEREEQESLSG
jgi:cobalt-zinc-cadmium efflux system membrane fusion protein